MDNQENEKNPATDRQSSEQAHAQKTGGAPGGSAQSLAKTLLLAVWAACIINLVAPFSWGEGSTFLYWFFWLLMAIHLLECLLYRKLIVKKSGNPLLGFAQVMVFGMLYIQNLARDSGD